MTADALANAADTKACVVGPGTADGAAARLKRDGIVSRLVIDKNEPSGTALILVDAKGQNVISVALGANGTLSADDIGRHIQG